MDQELQAARRSATTPREKFELLILELRAGNSSGLTLVFDDEQANAAAKAGERITLTSRTGDLVLVEKKDHSVHKIVGPFLAVINSESPLTAIVVDKLDASFTTSETIVYLNKTDRIIVWRRKGAVV